MKQKIYPLKSISWERVTYYVDLACPLENVTTKGSHTPLEKKPGCGEIPGPTGMPASRAGGCPCAIGVPPTVMSNLHIELINFIVCLL